jgi:hypothetical protein
MAQEAYVAIKSFGDVTEADRLATYFNRTTLFHAYVSQRSVIVRCRIYELGDLFALIAADPELEWIEYTVWVN